MVRLQVQNSFFTDKANLFSLTKLIISVPVKLSCFYSMILPLEVARMQQWQLIYPGRFPCRPAALPAFSETAFGPVSPGNCPMTKRAENWPFLMTRDGLLFRGMTRLLLRRCAAAAAGLAWTSVSFETPW